MPKNYLSSCGEGPQNRGFTICIFIRTQNTLLDLDRSVEFRFQGRFVKLIITSTSNGHHGVASTAAKVGARQQQQQGSSKYWPTSILYCKHCIRLHSIPNPSM